MKNLIFRTGLMVVLIALTTSSCNKIPEELSPEELPTLDLNATQKSIVESENSFAFDRLRRSGLQYF